MTRRSSQIAILIAMFASRPSFVWAAPAADDVRRLIQEGDALYAKRFTDQQAWKALAQYQKALYLDSGNFETLWRAARVVFWIANGTEDKKIDRLLGQQGYHYATLAIKAQPLRVEGHYFAALCIGEYGNAISIPLAILQRIDGKLIKHTREALRIDHGYDDGAPHRILGVYYHVIPWPKRDNQKAVAQLLRALRHGADNPWTRYYLALVLGNLQRKHEGRTHLDYCLNLDPGRGDPPERQRVRALCRKLAASY
jgi:tetratricopeptide (TPR) repeat protein